MTMCSMKVIILNKDFKSQLKSLEQKYKYQLKIIDLKAKQVN